MTISRQRLTRLEREARYKTQRFFTCFSDNKTFIVGGKEYTDEATMRTDNGIDSEDTLLKVIAPLTGLMGAWK